MTRPIGETARTTARRRAACGLFIPICIGLFGAAPNAAAAEGEPGSGNAFRDCPVCPEMVAVSAGSFLLGTPSEEKERAENEGPQRRVVIARPFAVGKFEVTFDEWDACHKAGACAQAPYDYDWGGGRRPVIYASWDDAKEYVAWLSRQTGKPYRLLTEAEWEYAARAGTTTRYHFGDSISKLEAQYSEGIWGSARMTVEVGAFPPNAWGLHGVHGNAAEWVEDCWNASHEGASLDGIARMGPDCSFRVLRGGSWSAEAWYLRAGARQRLNKSSRQYYTGLRVGRTLAP